MMTSVAGNASWWRTAQPRNSARKRTPSLIADLVAIVSAVVNLHWKF
jgi:hypothetical protein